MAEIGDLVPIDDNNTARWPEGMAPSGVNDAGRADEGILARWHRDSNGSLTSTGTGSAYQLTTNQNLTGYYDGLEITFVANVASNASPTLQLGTLGAAEIQTSDGQSLAAGDIPSGSVINVISQDNSTTPTWRLMNLSNPGNFARLNAKNTFTTEPQIIQQTDDSSLAGPSWYLERIRTTPAAGDDCGAIFFDAADSTGANQNFGTMRMEIVDPTNGSHDGQIKFRTAADALFGDRFIIARGMTAGGVTGGDPGFDRLNFFEYYKNGQPLVEVFESSQQSISAGGLVTVAHGLSAVPQMYSGYLINNTADLNWSPGDEIHYFWGSTVFDSSGGAGNAGWHCLYVDDSTNIKLRLGTRLRLTDKNTGTNTTDATFSSWRVVIVPVFLSVNLSRVPSRSLMFVESST